MGWVQQAKPRHQRRGAVVVYVAISLTVIMAFAALAIDMGALYTAKSELQRAADAAALAAAGQLIGGGDGDVDELVVEAADEVARKNPVFAAEMGVTAASNVEMGRATYNAATGKFTFQQTGEPYDATRVTLRRSSNSAAGPIQLMFARALGHDTHGLEATAAAVLVPRDIAVVIDLSNSMCHDSQLRYWDRGDGGSSNLRDVWAALNGPEPSRPYMPGPETETEYADDTGPTFGLMEEWGDPLLPGSYDATDDEGLVYYRKGQTINDGDLEDELIARGYSASEASALMSGYYDGTKSHWRNRIAVLLGLAEWRSGKNGGKFDVQTDGGQGFNQSGDGDNKLENNEMTAWEPYPEWRNGGWSWTGYIDFVANHSVYKYQQTEFRYRYGLKTLTDYLIDYYPENYRNTNLWATPEQPLRATKDAVQTMIDTISELDSLDHVSLEIFASTSRHEVNLTANLQDIADTLYARQSGHYDRATNIAGGLMEAYAELKSDRARGNSRKVIMLMSDGVANTDEQGNFLGDGSAASRQFAVDRAEQAADDHMVIHTVSVGYGVDRGLMQEIAAIGKGQEFYAVGSPEEYTEQLEDIFRALGGKRPVALIE